MLGLERRDRRRAFRTLVYAGVSIALIVFVWLHFDGLAQGDRGDIAKLALAIVGMVSILHATEHVTKIVKVDGPAGLGISVGASEAAREVAEAADERADEFEEKAR